jgi:hypothetical protein
LPPLTLTIVWSKVSPHSNWPQAKASVTETALPPLKTPLSPVISACHGWGEPSPQSTKVYP